MQFTDYIFLDGGLAGTSFSMPSGESAASVDRDIEAHSQGYVSGESGPSTADNGGDLPKV